MREVLAITKAFGDETRVRAVLALGGGELCLCHLVELLQLAPSTVSKHLDVLCQAGLVKRRRKGRWRHFCLPGRKAPPVVRRALTWIRTAAADDATVINDARRLQALRRKDVQVLAACYRG